MLKNHNITFAKCLLGGFLVAILSLIYNFLAFHFWGVQPDLSFDVSFLHAILENFYLVVFVKNFFVGIVLMWLFGLGYWHIKRDRDEGGDSILAVIYFSAYGIFALVSFSIVDLVLLDSDQGVLLLVTLDGVVEGVVAMMPLRIILR